MSSEVADRVLGLAWRQVNRDNEGFIFSADLPQLIIAIDGILKKTLLNETGIKIIRDFSKNDPTKRIFKDQFFPLFQNLVGVSFESAIDTIGFIAESNNDRSFKSNRKYNRDPFSEDSIGADIPNFRTEYRKYERLNGVKDDEILYRDKIIENLEKNKKSLQKNEYKIKELNIKNDSLEQDVIYRDHIIISKQNEIDDQEKLIKKLESKVLQLEHELISYKDSSITSNKYNDDRSKFNKELLNKVKSQQELINSLQKAISEKKEVFVRKPIYISTKNSSFPTFQYKVNNLLQLFQYPLFSVLLLLLTLLFALKYAHFSWKDALIERIINNNDMDYDYYNLGDIESDFQFI